MANLSGAWCTKISAQLKQRALYQEDELTWSLLNQSGWADLIFVIWISLGWIWSAFNMIRSDHLIQVFQSLPRFQLNWSKSSNTRKMISSDLSHFSWSDICRLDLCQMNLIRIEFIRILVFVASHCSGWLLSYPLHHQNHFILISRAIVVCIFEIQILNKVY